MRKKCITGLLLISLCTGLVIPAHGNAAQKKWKLNVTKKTLTVKKSTTLKVKGFKKTAKSKIRWKSTKPKIASVNQKGVVKAKAKGKAKIRATILIKGKKKATLTCNIKVKKAAKTSVAKTSTPKSSTNPVVSALPSVAPTTVTPTTAPTASSIPTPTKIPAPTRTPRPTDFLSNSQLPNLQPDTYETYAQTIKADSESNPITTNGYVADPTAISYNGRMYVYLTNDQQNYELGLRKGNNDYKNIMSIRVISTADMVNWQDHGVINLTGKDGICNKYAGDGSHSWAPSVVWRNENGKDRFYLYYTNNGANINVVVADSPTGPFRDEIGKPLIEGWNTKNNKKEALDPGVFIDDDGTGYLAYGYTNRGAGIIQLGDDLMSTVGSTIDLNAPAFFEDSELNKIGDTYYYSYCTDWNTDNRTGDYATLGQCHIAYMTSKSPMGPYTYAGDIFDNAGDAFGTISNNHHHMIEFKGQWYMLYHTLEASNRNGNFDRNGNNVGHRCLQVNSFSINEDGSIGKINQDMKGVSQIQAFDPYELTEGTVYSDCAGAITSHMRENKTYVEDSYFEPVTDVSYQYSWSKISAADFGDGSDQMTLEANFECDTTETKEVTFKVLLDTRDGQTVLSTKLTPDATGNVSLKLPVDKITGAHDIYFAFDGHVKKFANWKFTK